ncbi:MAG: hypothetical protein ACE5M4_09355 [Anaerolineales bacterium]
MKVSKKNFEWAIAQGLVTRGQAAALWLGFQERAKDRPNFDLANVYFYAAALIVIATMAFAVFGAIGVVATMSNLAYDVFEDSSMFPIALSLIGVAILGIGIFSEEWAIFKSFDCSLAAP